VTSVEEDLDSIVVNEAAEQTVHPMGNSGSLGANVPGKPRAFMRHVRFPPDVVNVAKCEEVVAKSQKGFSFL